MAKTVYKIYLKPLLTRLFILFLSMISIAIIGTGRLARQLFHLFNSLEGYTPSLILGRNEGDLAQFKNTQTSSDFNKTILEDLVFLAISDRAIETVSNQINAPNALVCHCSGSIPISALKKHTATGVFYPLQTFGSNEFIDFSKVPLLLEASQREGIEKLSTLAQEVSSHVDLFDANKRKSIHLAAVWVNNFSNFLFSEAAAYCNSKDIDFKLLGPLMKQTVHNALDLGPDIAQTGPARRGDTNTIKTHIASLESISQKKIYQYISDAIQDKYKHEL
tara:strand:+ start:1116 stop:1946 length:831 start_codon:yes stop_codon:yes gene_type:complete